MDIAYSRPRFRTDLVAKPFDEAGQRFVDVTDPDSGKTFRFYEIEYSIACAMDGRRDLAGLVEWAQAELGVEPSPDELKTVISTLDDLGYLDQGARSGFALGTAGAAMDDEPEEAFASGDEFELGNAGKSPLDMGDEERLDAPELTLGVSGNEEVETGPGELPAALSDYDEAPTMIKKVGNLRDLTGELSDPGASQVEPTTVQPMLRPVSRARSAADEEGPTNIPPPVADFDEEVSVDLTDHMRIGAADVKEAVRQSKAMPAVDVPSESGQRPNTRNLTVEEEDDGSATIEHEAPRLAPPPGPQPRMQTPPPVPSSPAATTELPDAPALVSEPLSAPSDDGSGRVSATFRAERSGAVEAPASKSRVGVLLVILLVVGLGAGAAYYFLIYVPSQQAAIAPPPAATPEPVAPEPPKPEPPSAKLAATPVDPVSVTASEGGEIKEILASGTEVEENDVVVKLSGYEAAQRKIDDLLSDVARYQKRIAAAEEKKQKAEESNPGSGARYQKEIDREQQKITDREQAAEAARQEMEPYLVRAPIAGKIVTERAVGQKIAAGDAVFGIELPPRLQAVFTLETGDLPDKHTKVQLAAKGDESKTGMCTVSEIDDRTVTVICPSTEPFADGADVVMLP